MERKKNDKGKWGIVFSWTGNAAVNFPIILSFIGFFYAALLFLPAGCGDEYHDLRITNKKDIADSLLNARIGKLRLVYSELLPKKDSPTSKEDFKLVRNALQQALTDRHRLQHANADTNAKYYVGYLTAERSTVYRALAGLRNDADTIHIPTVVQDPPVFAHDTATTDMVRLVVEKTSQPIVEFVTRYPNAGFLYLLSIGQMVAWCLILALVLGSLMKTDNIGPDYRYNLENASLHLVLPTMAIALFAIFFYQFLVDDHVIRDVYFLDGFNGRMSAYSIPGYAVAVFCFGSYLFLSNKLDLMDQTETAVSEEDYKKLKSAFDFSFFCCALILSLFVFFLGVLFHTVNDIEAMRFYTVLSGRPFIDYNYVYLVGLMHSILLAIFYIPVRIRFNSMKRVQKEKEEDKDGSGKKFFKAVWESLGSILITISPLLATVVEKLVNALLD